MFVEPLVSEQCLAPPTYAPRSPFPVPLHHPGFPLSQRSGDIVELLVSEQSLLILTFLILAPRTIPLHHPRVPRSQRSGEIVEPLVSEQWFVRMEPLAKPALQAVADGTIKLLPERFERVYNNWLDNIKVWAGNMWDSEHCVAG